MVGTSLYINFNRLSKKRGTATLYTVITKKQKRALINTGIELQPGQWENGKVVNHPQARLMNAIILQKQNAVEQAVILLTARGDTVLKDAYQIAELIRLETDEEYREEQRKRDITRQCVKTVFSSFCNTKNNPGTVSLYQGTLKQIEKFCADTKRVVNTLALSEIDKGWLTEFENYCRRTQKQNTVNIHLRNLRAIFNYAIDNGLCENYPFRKFRIKQQPTLDKSYTSEELKRFFRARCNNKGEEEARDMFLLMFLLIGINPVDLYNAEKPQRGRLNYTRRKTQKPYSIKIEPETDALIRKYAGEKYMLNIKERFGNYKTYFRRLNRSLCKIGKEVRPGEKSQGEALLPRLNPGAARTSWATIAQAELGISRDVIAAALGHNTIDVTTTYLRTHWGGLIDQANRKMIDLIFG